MDDIIHNCKVFFKLINKDCLYFINKICLEETKRIVLNIFITVSKIFNK